MFLWINKDIFCKFPSSGATDKVLEQKYKKEEGHDDPVSLC